MRRTVAIVAFATALSLTARAADPLQERVLAVARSVTAEDYAFTRFVRIERSDGGKITQGSELERYDPTKPPDQRWTLVARDGRPPTAEELKKYTRDTARRRAAHYGRIANYFASPATTSTDSRGRTVFRFASVPNETVVLGGNDVSATAVCEATVNTTGAVPFVEEARFTLAKPVRVKLVAKLDRGEVVSRYRMMPNGKPIPTEHISDLHGSLMGRQGRIKSVLTYTEHRALR